MRSIFDLHPFRMATPGGCRIWVTRMVESPRWVGSVRLDPGSNGIFGDDAASGRSCLTATSRVVSALWTVSNGSSRFRFTGVTSLLRPGSAGWPISSQAPRLCGNVLPKRYSSWRRLQAKR